MVEDMVRSLSILDHVSNSFAHRGTRLKQQLYISFAAWGHVDASLRQEPRPDHVALSESMAWNHAIYFMVCSTGFHWHWGFARGRSGKRLLEGLFRPLKRAGLA
jgi:hypothetical protein